MALRQNQSIVQNLIDQKQQQQKKNNSIKCGETWYQHVI